jgi:hypothetical protein
MLFGVSVHGPLSERRRIDVMAPPEIPVGVFSIARNDAEREGKAAALEPWPAKKSY